MSGFELVAYWIDLVLLISMFLSVGLVKVAFVAVTIYLTFQLFTGRLDVKVTGITYVFLLLTIAILQYLGEFPL